MLTPYLFGSQISFLRPFETFGKRIFALPGCLPNSRPKERTSPLQPPFWAVGVLLSAKVFQGPPLWRAWFSQLYHPICSTYQGMGVGAPPPCTEVQPPITVGTNRPGKEQRTPAGVFFFKQKKVAPQPRRQKTAFLGARSPFGSMAFLWRTFGRSIYIPEGSASVHFRTRPPQKGILSVTPQAEAGNVGRRIFFHSPPPSPDDVFFCLFPFGNRGPFGDTPTFPGGRRGSLRTFPGGNGTRDPVFLWAWGFPWAFPGDQWELPPPPPPETAASRPTRAILSFHRKLFADSFLRTPPPK